MQQRYGKGEGVSTISILSRDLGDQLPLSLFKGCTGSSQRSKAQSLGAFIDSMTDPENEALVELCNDLARLKREDEKAYKQLKETQCPAFLPGDFTARTIEGCQQYAPLLGFDIDCLKDEIGLLATLEDCKTIPYLFAAFPSPSQQGLRLLVWAPSTPNTHKEFYQAIAKQLAIDLGIDTDRALTEAWRKEGLTREQIKERLNQVEHIDTSTNNFSRIWFYTHVPKDRLYINWESVVFTLDRPSKAKKSEVKTTKKEAESISQDVRVKLCVDKVNRQDIPAGRNNYVYALSAEFRRFGVFRDRALRECLVYVEGDFPESEVVKTLDSAYQRKGQEFSDRQIRKYMQMIEGKESIELPSPQKTEPEQEQQQKPFFKFFSIKQDNGKVDLKINYLKLVQLLKDLGFRRYDVDGEFFIVKVTDNVVRECPKQEVIDTFENYIIDFPEDDFPKDISKALILNKVYASIGTYFSDNVLGRLRPDKPILFNEHQKDRAYFYYQNGYVEVTKEAVTLKPYGSLRHCIWENQILERDFKLIDDSKYSDFSFVQFVRNIANCWEVHPRYNHQNERLDPIRLESFKTVIGYLLHAFFDRELRAILFTDSRISDNDEPNGRSGKTLLLKALGHVLNRDIKRSKTFVELNGKDFDTGKQFKYQELGLDTRLVHINDVKRNFKIEELFNDITEGIKRERKNESPSIIRAKMALSTNLTIRIKGSSAKGRSVEIELAEYYDEHWTPYTEFGKWFFAEWDQVEWNMFDSFMMDCVKAYLQNGIIQPDTINLHERKKVEETSPEFVAWMEYKSTIFEKEEFAHHVGLDGAFWWDKKKLFDEFKGQYTDFHRLTQRRFNKWLKDYCQYDSQYEKITSSHEKQSNGIYYIKLKTTQTQ